MSHKLFLLSLLGLLQVSCGGSGDPGANNAIPAAPTGTCVAGARNSASNVKLVNAFPNVTLSLPVALIPAQSGNLLYVVELSGTVKIIENNPASSSVATFVDISSKVSLSGEGGLLGMAFDPNYATNGYVYLSYTAPGNATTSPRLYSRIARYTKNAGSNSLDVNSEDILLEIPQPWDNHNGGQIAFGADGYLYIGFGDGGASNDAYQNGQNIETLLGAMLRIDVSGVDPVRNTKYKIPASNPFAAHTTCTGGCPEIYAWGLRNPWRWSFDRVTGSLWAGDVGQNAYEEVDLIESGKNYGWGCYEGLHANTAYAGTCPANLVHTPPVLEYGRAEGSTVTGGYVYRGTTIPALVGQYIFADYGSGTVWAVENPSVAPQRRTLVSATPGNASMAEDQTGELYLLNIFDQQIYKLVPDTISPTVPGFAAQLSQTGCADPANPKLAVTGMVPYELNAPLWSDGASKRRWIALPPSGHVAIEADHDWSFPIGAVLRKDFYLGNQIVETRLFARHTDGGWAGYSYEWNAAQTDATLLNDTKTINVASQTWTYPSPAQCLECHTAAAGHALGPETAQLNRTIPNPVGSGSINQLNYLQDIHVFSTTLPAISTLPKLADYNDSSNDLTLRARAYLHANCSHCHRPNSIGRSKADFRYAVSFANMNVCNALPEVENVSGATHLLSPMNTADSILYQRMLDTGAARMPPIGTVLVDTSSTTLISDWINTITICP